ncbi:hypothetical protein FRB96_000452 [Tulasnella sp. 330]|nr:hypothetical protein FRB96_000452 [Tulasnella sp. 330]
MSHDAMMHSSLPNGAASRTISQARLLSSEASDSAPYRQATTRTYGTSPSIFRPSDHSTTTSEVEKLRRLKQQIMDNQVPFYLSGAASTQALEALYVPHKPTTSVNARPQNSLEPEEAVQEGSQATVPSVTNSVSDSDPASVLDTQVQHVESQKSDPEEHKAVGWRSYSTAVETAITQPHPGLAASTTMDKHTDAMDVELEDVKPIILDASRLLSESSRVEPGTENHTSLHHKQTPNNLPQNLTEQPQSGNCPHPPMSSGAVVHPTPSLASDDAKPVDRLANGSAISTASSQNREMNRQTSDAPSRRPNEDQWDARYTRPPEIALRAREALLRSSRPRPREVTPNDIGQDFRMRDHGPPDSSLPARPHDVYRTQEPPRDRSVPMSRPFDVPPRRSPDRDIPYRRVLSSEPRPQSPPRGRPTPRENNYRPASPPPRPLERERVLENPYRPNSPPPRLAPREPYRGSPGRDLEDYQRRSMPTAYDDRMADRGPPRPGYHDYRPRSPTTGEYPSKRLARDDDSNKTGQYGNSDNDALRSRPPANTPPTSTHPDSSTNYSKSQPQPEAPRVVTDAQRPTTTRGRPKAGELNESYSPLPSNDSLPNRPPGGTFDGGAHVSRSVSGNLGQGPSPTTDNGRPRQVANPPRAPIPLANRISGVLPTPTDLTSRTTNTTNGKNSNVSPPYSDPSSEDVVMVQKLLNDAPSSETTAASSLRSPPKTSTAPAPTPSNVQNQQDSYRIRTPPTGYSGKEYVHGSGTQNHSVPLPSRVNHHQAEIHDRAPPLDYYRAAPPNREDLPPRYGPPRYADARGIDAPRDNIRPASRDDWAIDPRHDWDHQIASDDRGPRLDDRRALPPTSASLPYSRRRSPSPVPLSRRLSPPRVIKELQGPYRDPYAYPEDRRSVTLKRVREDAYEMDVRRMPPPGWQDRDTYERNYQPLPPPNDNRAPYPPYPPNTRSYRDRSPPPPGTRDVYESYSRGYDAYLRPLSPEVSGPGWYGGPRDQSYRR